MSHHSHHSALHGIEQGLYETYAQTDPRNQEHGQPYPKHTARNDTTPDGCTDIGTTVRYGTTVNYAAYCAEEKEALQDTDYRVRTSKVDRIALLHNPTGYASKKPELWYQLTSLMKSAEHSVKIHTPYIICNDYMYDSLAEIADQVDQVSIMTNSVGNNGNPFGGADYLENKDKILATGVDVWEYEGGTSYHGKSVLIDDHIAVVGSFNLDMRSVYLDTELMLVIDSKEVAGMLGDAMDAYETKARKANPDGTYENPNHVEPRKISEKKQRQIELIRKFGKNLRFLF